MCTALSHKTKITELIDYFPFLQAELLQEFDEERASYRLAFEHSEQPVIIAGSSGYEVRLFEWGVISNYMNTPESVKKNRAWMCNARAEKLADPKSYWYKIKTQRCLVPTTGIYEHRRVKGFKNKIPYYVSLKNREMFCLPGLFNYSSIPDKDTGELPGTFSIITRAANPLMQLIHNDGENKFRMPLFLPKEMEMEWIDPNTPWERILEILSFEIADEELAAWPVYTLNTPKPRPDGLLKNKPFQWQGLPQLGEESTGGLQQELF